MTTLQLQQHIGRVGLVRFHGLDIWVKVLDSRIVFARVDLLVTPVQGDGKTWIDAARFKASNEEGGVS